MPQTRRSIRTQPCCARFPTLDEGVLASAGASRSALGTGGMRTKLRAAQLVTAAGESVLIANGTTPGILDAIFAFEPVGTLVPASWFDHAGLEALGRLYGAAQGTTDSR